MRFIIVNDKKPRHAKECCMCPTKLENGYVRDLFIGTFYCSEWCLDEHIRGTEQRLLAVR